MGAIEIDRVRKSFPGATRPAVVDCSLTVEDGEFTVLLGPSGSGKTTLLKLINRLYDPDSGRILIDGVDVQSQPAPQLRRQIGYVIQQIGLFPHLRVEDNIATVPRLMGWPPERINARTNELIDLVGLPRAYRKRYPRQLSGGEQQRVGLARALAADPRIMLMDEPFGALDAITRTRLQEELRAIHQHLRKTIVFVTHDVDEALRLADRIAVIRDGQVIQHDRPLAIITRPRDDFVRRLLTSDDVLRQLSLVPVEVVAARGRVVPAPGAPVVKAGQDLRTALGLLLRSGAPAVMVVGNGGDPIGQVTFEDIRRAVISSQAGAQAQTLGPPERRGK